MESKKLSELNPFKDFDFDKNRSMLACIGNNSGIVPWERDLAIIEGYKVAAKLLFEGIEKGEEFQDACVYPLFFSCRHSIELSLKMIVNTLMVIYKERNKITNDDTFCQSISKNLNEHSIEKLVDSFKKLQDFDCDIKAAFNELEDFDLYIRDYYFDVESDAFRYTYKNDKTTLNLADKTLLNTGILYKKYSQLMNQLDYFYCYFCSLLVRHYRTGTFTKELSRNQLEKISKMININDLDNFDENKKKIIEEYNLSNNQFSKALDMIKNHREFSSNIGKELIFENIKESTIKDLAYLINLGVRINNIPKLEKKSIFSPDEYSEEDKYLKENLENEFDEKGKKLFNEIDRKEINELLSFYEINKLHDYFSEDLDSILKYWQKFGSIDEDYVLSKLCFATDFVKAFKKCGQTTYLEWFEKYSNQ